MGQLDLRALRYIAPSVTTFTVEVKFAGGTSVCGPIVAVPAPEVQGYPAIIGSCPGCGGRIVVPLERAIGADGTCACPVCGYRLLPTAAGLEQMARHWAHWKG